MPSDEALPERLRTVLAARQIDDATTGEQAASEALLILVLEHTAGRVVGPALNGWRKALARPPGSLLVIHEAEVQEFQRGAPDLASFLTAQQLRADSSLPLWDEESCSSLRRAWLEEPYLRLPEAVQSLPGEPLDEDEFRAWLRSHCGSSDP